MNKLQIFSSSDPFKEFKIDIQKNFTSYFFSESPIDKEFIIQTGNIASEKLTEKIITDGTINKIKKGIENSNIIWKDELVTLEKPTTLILKLEDISFLIDIINYKNESQYNIYTRKETKEVLEKIRNILIGKYNNQDKITTVALKDSKTIILENFNQGKISRDILNLKSGSTSKKYRKGKH